MIQDEHGNLKVKEMGFADLPEVQQDMEVFFTKIQSYGFEDNDYDIIQKTNLSCTAVRKVFTGCQKKINENSDVGKKTLTIVYYGGHGMMSENMS